MFKAFYIQKHDHFGIGHHGIYNRLGLFNRTFDALTSLVLFNSEEASGFCDKTKHSHSNLRYGPISLSEKDYFTAKCSQLYMSKHGMLPNIEDIETLYKVNGNPLNIITEPTLVTQSQLV